MTPMNMLIAKKVSGGYDPSAQSVIDAIQLSVTLNSTQKDAINARIVAMKVRGTWTKYIAYYGFVGGTAAAHKWNWKDPRDLDAAFRGVFNGTCTQSANGMQPNGSTGYMDTFIASTNLTLNSTALLIYSRTDDVDGAVDIGCNDGNSFELAAKRSGNIQSDAYDTGTGRLEVANANSQGYYVGSRLSSSDSKIYKNGSQVATTSATAGALPVGINVAVGCRNVAGAPNNFSNMQFASAGIATGLTGTEVANEYTDEQAFQTSLSRQV